MIVKEDEAFLKHFGTKGMRWGQRKERARIAARNKAIATYIPTIRDPHERAQVQEMLTLVGHYDKINPGWDKTPKQRRKLKKGEKTALKILSVAGGINLAIFATKLAD